VQNDKAGQDRRGIRGPVAATACGYEQCPQKYDQHDRSRRKQANEMSDCDRLKPRR